MIKLTRVSLSLLFSLLLSACVPLPDGAVVSSSVSDWTQLEPQELHGNLVTAFSGMRLQDAKRRTVYNIMRQEQVTVPDEGLITVMWLLSRHATWGGEVQAALGDRNAFKRYVQKDFQINRDANVTVEFLDDLIRVAHFPSSSRGYLVSTRVRHPNGNTATCVVSLLEYTSTRMLRTPSETSDPRFLLYALLCGPRLRLADLQQRLYAVSF